MESHEKAGSAGMEAAPKVGAVVMAAGRSRRMGQAKLSLPWGETTVIGQVVETLEAGGIEEILVVAGLNLEEVEGALQGSSARVIFNPDYEMGGMLSTFQIGVQSLQEDTEAALAVLGDQPQMQAAVVEQVLKAYQQTRAQIIAPSYSNRRGHPWLLDRSLWPDVLSLSAPATLRDFLHQYDSLIHYLEVATESVVQDIDTPEDYQHYRPKND
jgi:molybdenum cofactor cytidylyltransferase